MIGLFVIGQAVHIYLSQKGYVHEMTEYYKSEIKLLLSTDRPDATGMKEFAPLEEPQEREAVKARKAEKEEE